ncbi:hypothetical protein NL676_018734 [Syzygium grande]|nr:hypothetical protein NL676_018734 [Syzygium grande]
MQCPPCHSPDQTQPAFILDRIQPALEPAAPAQHGTGVDGPRLQCSRARVVSGKEISGELAVDAAAGGLELAVAIPLFPSDSSGIRCCPLHVSDMATSWGPGGGPKPSTPNFCPPARSPPGSLQIYGTCQGQLPP